MALILKVYFIYLQIKDTLSQQISIFFPEQIFPFRNIRPPEVHRVIWPVLVILS